MLLTQEQEQIRDMLRDFAREQLAPFAAEWDRNATFPREALRQLGELGVETMSSTPAEFTDFMAKETTKYAKLIKEANIKAE